MFFCIRICCKAFCYVIFDLFISIKHYSKKQLSIVCNLFNKLFYGKLDKFEADEGYHHEYRANMELRIAYYKNRGQPPILANT